MDRISALRNVEDALVAFEDGEATLADLEADVRGILRTYAADLDGELTAYRATADDNGELVVVASSGQAARERVRELVDAPRDVSVEPME